MITLELRYPSEKNSLIQDATAIIFEPGLIVVRRPDQDETVMEWPEVAQVILKDVARADKVIGHAEDVVFNATRGGDDFVLSAFDALSGMHRTEVIRREALTAIVMLCYGNDEIENSDFYYSVAEPVLKDWPNEVRMIP